MTELRNDQGDIWDEQSHSMLKYSFNTFISRPLERRSIPTSPVRRSSHQTCKRIKWNFKHKVYLVGHFYFQSKYLMLLGTMGDSLYITNGVLHPKIKSDDLWTNLLLRSRIPDLLKELHDSPTGGHVRMLKTLQKAVYTRAKKGEMLRKGTYLLMLVHLVRT